jgi:hypothetical protein
MTLYYEWNHLKQAETENEEVNRTHFLKIAESGINFRN